MEVINFAEQNSVINQYMAELRDKNYQKNRMLFRRNIERIGEMMAYEISKTLEYKPKTIKTPLGTLDIPLLKEEDMVIATVLRAGLPFHQGFLNVFDNADNAFVSAFRMYLNREHTEVGVHTEYIATPSVKGKTLLIVDPMLATGGSLAAAIDSLLQAGKPKKIHLCCVIAAPEGIEVVKAALPEGSTIWCAAIDEGMNEQKYIVPGFGDCGDLCYGEKLQSFRKIADKK
ncbi:MAG: uracil phosphoribosyltransferase [Prevotella sp.]|nr:uracil phosphoribosyltransferase [Prevotella sp.]